MKKSTKSKKTIVRTIKVKIPLRKKMRNTYELCFVLLLIDQVDAPQFNGYDDIIEEELNLQPGNANELVTSSSVVLNLLSQLKFQGTIRYY
jgi:hypothetical protein